MGTLRAVFIARAPVTLDLYMESSIRHEAPSAARISDSLKSTRLIYIYVPNGRASVLECIVNIYSDRAVVIDVLRSNRDAGRGLASTLGVLF